MNGMMGHFVEGCRRGVLKVNGDKSKVMLLCGEEEFGYEIHVDGAQLEQVLELKYYGFVLN